MTTWVASDWWGAYIAEVGPYTGAWPPTPPIPANLPDPVDAAEIDYIIAPPGITLDDVVNGAYDNLADLWRSWIDTGPETRSNFAVNTFGHVLSSPAPTLFVGYYLPDFDWPGSAPAVAAELLVPPSYAATGTGVELPDAGTFGWSAEQPEQTYTDVHYVFGGDNTYSLTRSDFVNGVDDPDRATKILDAQALARTIPHDNSAFGSPWFVGDAAAEDECSIFFQEVRADLVTAGLPENYSFSISQLVNTLFPASLDRRTLLYLGEDFFTNALIEGIDFALAFNGGDLDDESNYTYVEYDGLPWDTQYVPPANRAWNDTSIDLDFIISSTSDQAANYLPFEVYIGDELTSAGWRVYGDYSDLIYVGTFTPNPIDFQDRGTQQTTFSVDGSLLSDFVSPVFFVMNPWLGPPDVPVTDNQTPITGALITRLQNIVIHVHDSDVPPSGTFVHPRWRYWGRTTTWRTVGGPWATPSGVELRILTPQPGGNQWIDVAPA